MDLDVHRSRGVPLLSGTSEHALRAVSWIARAGGGSPVVSADVAAGANVPRRYLSKILAKLTHAGVLVARPGLTGGYRLARPAERIRLLDVVAPFEPSDTDGACVFGDGRRCGVRRNCALHRDWSRVRRALKSLLGRTTLAQVVKSGKRR